MTIAPAATATELQGDPSGKGAAAAPTTVEVEVDGKKFSVPAEVAKGITAAREAETAAKTTAAATVAREAELRQQLETVTKQLPKGDSKGETNPDAIETLLFTDPAKAAQRIIEQAKSEIRAEQAVVTAQQGFWNSFYEQNPDMKDKDLLIKALFNAEFATMKPMTLEKARDHLAEVSKKELLRLGVTTKAKKQPTAAEGGTERSDGRQSKGTDVSESSPAAPGGLTAVLMARKAARREGREKATATN